MEKDDSMAAERARAKSIVSTDEHQQQQPFELSLFSEGGESAIEKEDQTKTELSKTDPEFEEMNPSVLQQQQHQRYSSSDDEDDEETSSSGDSEEESQSSDSSR